jgi:DUF4097 and DUF4098 domain-containing protein YvlB
MTEVSEVKGKLILLVCGTLAMAGASAKDVDESIAAAPDGHVEISNTAGSIEVQGWSKNVVEVTGDIGERVEELVLERDGDRVTVKVKVPRNSGGNIDSDIVVRVPEKSSIDVSGVSADIAIENVRGEQGLHTVSGDIETQAFGADIEAASVSGDVDIEGKGENIDTRAGTVSGDVTLVRLGGEVTAEAVSGDVTVEEGSFDRVAIETVNGDLTFLAELHKGGKLAVETVNGDVEIEFAGKISAEFDIDSFNGEIDSCFGPEPRRTSKYAPGLELRFTEGDGDGSVSVSTLNGDIHICR